MDLSVSHMYAKLEFKCIKGYLHYKTIFCHKVALYVQLMDFFIWNENNVSFFYGFIKVTI